MPAPSHDLTAAASALQGLEAAAGHQWDIDRQDIAKSQQPLTNNFASVVV
jgi:hypothetical protein